MINREKDALVEQLIFGKVPCDGMLLQFKNRWPEKVHLFAAELDDTLNFQATSLFDVDLPEKIVDVALECAEKIFKCSPSSS
jgi:hypothetical protein